MQAAQGRPTKREFLKFRSRFQCLTFIPSEQEAARWPGLIAEGFCTLGLPLPELTPDRSAMGEESSRLSQMQILCWAGLTRNSPWPERYDWTKLAHGNSWSKRAAQLRRSNSSLLESCEWLRQRWRKPSG